MEPSRDLMATYSDVVNRDLEEIQTSKHFLPAPWFSTMALAECVPVCDGKADRYYPLSV